MPTFLMKITYKTSRSKKWRTKEKTFKMSQDKFEELSKKSVNLIVGILFKMKSGLITEFELTEIE